ncbi:MAG: TonB family protein [Acidobacteria bacterium]|nr:TonB family protein [Acidobacteriota bacterium]
MTSKKTCHRCGHQIDVAARLCPYCNQEQVVRSLDGDEREITEFSPAATSPISAKTPVTTARRYVLAGGALVLLVGMFFIGWLVYALGQPDSQKGEIEIEEPPPAPADRPAPDITLVADGSGGPDIERAYTSRLSDSLNEDLPEEFQRRDATALPIAVYRRVVEEEKRREQERRTALVNPLEVTEAARPRRRVRTPTPPELEELPISTPLGVIPGTAPPVTEQTERPADPAGEQTGTASAQSASAAGKRTRPRPLSQPLPRILSRDEGTVHVNLTVGADGEVANVQVLQGMPGVTDQVVQAVRRWKFQPATVNGKPVESTYRVEIVVKPR